MLILTGEQMTQDPKKIALFIQVFRQSLQVPPVNQDIMMG